MALTQLGNVREAIGRFNTNQSSYTDEEQRNLLKLALHYGTAYEPEAKPISKGLYNFANIASFGLMPESWRPHSIGQDYYGERGIDRVAGGLGTLAGLVGGVGAATKLAPAVVSSFSGSGKAAQVIAKVKEAEAVKRADGIARSFYQGTVGRAQTFARDPLGMEKVFDFRNINMMP